MAKFFNIAGPCYPNEHYMLPAQERCQGLRELIDQKHYFVIHAAWQSGKTTLLLDLVQQLNASGDYYALYCSLEALQGVSEPEKGIAAIISKLQLEVEFAGNVKGHAFGANVDAADFTSALRKALMQFCESLDKPLVILFDEADCLSNGTLIAFLRQLRDGYVNRGRMPFVQAVALVGMRNIRDYKGKIREERETLGSASPFNIVSESLTLRNFTLEEVTRLYAQHAAQTGQAFPPAVTASIYAYTQGQPWLVNAIAREIVVKILAADFSRPITVAHVEQAVETIILRRDTHIDSLLERLKERRVQRILEPVILGESTGYDTTDDDYQYVLDLGLLRKVDKKLLPSNPIYAEVIIRALSSHAQMEMDQRDYPPELPAYLVDQRLDMRRLLTDFQQFWREHSAIWVERYEYKEAAPHLILQAFLQRVLNSGGQISREMAAGTGRLDLCIHYQGQRYPLEIKLRYSAKTYAEGVQQLAAYLDQLGCNEGWLIVFDRRKSVSWRKKLFWQTQRREGQTIQIVGC